MEIDDRAGALAAFALAMKAAAKLGRRRFLRMEAKPDICVLQNVSFTDAEMQDVAAVVGKDLFTDELRETLGQFDQAKNFGSLIVPKLRDPAETLRVVEARDFAGDLLLKDVQARVVAVLRMAEALSPKYHVVVANPPYMGWVGMNPHMKTWLGKTYPASKADLMTAFMSRATGLARANGYWAMINLPSWLFLSTFEKLRLQLIETQWLQSLLQLGRGIFGSDFGSTAFIFRNAKSQGRKGVYRRLFEEHVQVRDVETIRNLYLNWDYKHFETDQNEFVKIPGCPVAYWLSDAVRSTFGVAESLGDVATTRKGMVTASNETFIRAWQEVSQGISNYTAKSREDAKKSEAKWFPMIMGGDFRRWYGNREYVVNWENDGHVLQTRRHPTEDRVWATNFNLEFIFRPNINCNSITASRLFFRESPGGELFSSTGIGFFPSGDTSELVAFTNSNSAEYFLNILTPTVTANPGDIGRLPVLSEGVAEARNISKRLVEIARADWDAYETSWDFTTLPLLQPDHRAETLEATYTALRTHWQGMTDEMQRLEEENNRIFIDAYGLQDELTPEVPLNEITLTCNPAYRYGTRNDAEANETRLRADTMAEFLSYAVGCMFGRYSLDAPGLILANQGERLSDYLARIPEPRFMPDEDNVIPVLDADWFPDDITERFRLFLRVSFGEAHFRENLRYIEDALGKDIRKYFTRDFYADHVKRYKKRPIYWMFSSPRGTFNALIYMHRYRGDTVSVLLNDYLREFITKLEGERARLEKLSDDATATQGQRTKALKEAGVVAKQIDELHEWEREVIFPLAQQKIEIDLNDGVKANYPKFGAALKKIAGLEAKDD